MISYTGRATYIDLDHDQAVVEIRSALCLYRVVVRGERVNVIGPGVEEDYYVGVELPENLSLEARALIAIVLFELQEENT